MVCGGTGLYMDSLVNGVCFTEETVDESHMKKLEADWAARGGEAMLQELAVLDPACAARLHPRDKKRILRALYLSRAEGSTLAQRNAASRRAGSPYDALTMALCYDDRQEMYRRIEARVDAMLERGLLEEARWVYENRGDFLTAAQAIGYKELFPYFAGERGLAECVQTLKTATRRYAKRQLTWLRQHPPALWLAAGEDARPAARAAVEAFLKG